MRKQSPPLQATLQKRQVASRHNSHPGSFSKNQPVSVCHMVPQLLGSELTPINPTSHQ